MTEQKNYDLWHIGAELDDAAYMLESSARLVLLVHTAFIDGQSEPGKEDFEALFPVFCQIDDLAKKVREIGADLQEYRHRAAEDDGAAAVLRTLGEAYQAGLTGQPPRHIPNITTTEQGQREKMELYREAMNAMYMRGQHMKGIQETKAG